MQLAVTEDAANYIRERGGRVYLWQKPVGKSWAADHMGYEDPSRGITFTAVWASGIELMLAEDLEPPRNVRVDLSRLPRRLHIDWDGERWDLRGAAGGGGGGG